MLKKSLGGHPNPPFVQEGLIDSNDNGILKKN